MDKKRDDLWVWGVGNILLGDDAVGCRVVELLSVNGTQKVVDCGTTPENYVAKLSINPPKTLLIVDAADMQLPPGECRRLSLRDLEAVAETSHGIPHALLFAPFEGAIEIAAIGIQPETLQLGAPLSAVVEKAACEVAERISKQQWRDFKPLDRVCL